MTITRHSDGSTAKNLGSDLQFPGISLDSRRVEDLMERIIKGNDYPAFESLFKNMYAPLCRFCLKYVHSAQIAEELVSDVFFTIWKNRARIEVTSHRSYLFTSVRNRGLDHLRKMKRATLCNLEEASHIPANLPDSQEMMVETEFSHSIQKCVAALPKQCRLIFEMSREQGLKYKEIASTLNISIKTVETQMGRALKHLHQTIPSI
jgi:RNA polymerase sigma-70 factor (family 1)